MPKGVVRGLVEKEEKGMGSQLKEKVTLHVSV